MKKELTKATWVANQLYYVTYNLMYYYVDLETKTVTDRNGVHVPNSLKGRLIYETRAKTNVGRKNN